MMGEIAKLVEGSKQGTGYLDPAAADQTVAILLSAQSTPVITKKPDGAWTNSVYEASKKYTK
jgi:NitT/TauT family transport system substrate-binding protein